MSEKVSTDQATPPEKRRGRQPSDVAEGLKQALVEDALRVFARRGFDAVGLRELAAETGVAHNLIRHYYGSKEGLWRAAVDHAVDRYEAALAPLALDTAQAPVERAERAFKAFLDISGEHPDLVRLIMHEGVEGGERLDYVLQRFIALGDALEPLFDAVQDEGFLREFDNRTIFLVLVLSGAGPTALSALTRAVTGDDLHDAGQRERYARRLLGLLFRTKI